MGERHDASELAALGVADNPVRMQNLLSGDPSADGCGSDGRADIDLDQRASLAARAQRYAKALAEDETRPAK